MDAVASTRFFFNMDQIIHFIFMATIDAEAQFLLVDSLQNAKRHFSLAAGHWIGNTIGISDWQTTERNAFSLIAGLGTRLVLAAGSQQQQHREVSFV